MSMKLYRTVIVTFLYLVALTHSSFGLPVEFEVLPTQDSHGLSIENVLPNGDFVTVERFQANTRFKFQFCLHDGESGSRISCVITPALPVNTYWSVGGTRMAPDKTVILTLTGLEVNGVRGVGAVTTIPRIKGYRGDINENTAIVGNLRDGRLGQNQIFLDNGNLILWGQFEIDGTVKNFARMCELGQQCVGPITYENSLISDSSFYIRKLSGSRFVIVSPGWDGRFRDQGAVSRRDGNKPLVGEINARNSLVGDRQDQSLGLGGVKETRNGNFLIKSHRYKFPGSDIEGALTFVPLSRATVGTISTEDSLVGVGTGRITILGNGDFVYSNASWKDGAGFAVVGDGDIGISGPITPEIALMGEGYDLTGFHVYELANGAVAVTSPFWGEYKGAVTVTSKENPITGLVSESNSMVGVRQDDWIASGQFDYWERDAVVPLSNGNFVLYSPFFDQSKGAITLIKGEPGISGYVDEDNSLVGTVPYSFYEDVVEIMALESGNYLVKASYYEQEPLSNTHVFFGDGTRPTSGSSGQTTAIVGLSHYAEIFEIDSENYVVTDPAFEQRGLLLIGDSKKGTVGLPDNRNSLQGIQGNTRISSARILRDGYTAIGLTRDGEFGVAVEKTSDILNVDVSNVGMRNANVWSYGSSFLSPDLGAGNIITSIRQFDPREGRCAGLTLISPNTLLEGPLSEDNTEYGDRTENGDCFRFTPVFQEIYGRILYVENRGVKAINLSQGSPQVSLSGTVISRNRVPVRDAVIVVALENEKEITVRSNQFGRFSTPTFDGSRPVTITTRSRNHNFPIIRERVQWSLRNVELTAND